MGNIYSKKQSKVQIEQLHNKLIKQRKHELEREENKLTKCDLIAIIIALEPSYSTNIEIIESYNMNDLNAIIRIVIYNPLRNINSIISNVNINLSSEIYLEIIFLSPIFFESKFTSLFIFTSKSATIYSSSSVAYPI